MWSTPLPPVQSPEGTPDAEPENPPDTGGASSPVIVPLLELGCTTGNKLQLPHGVTLAGGTIVAIKGCQAGAGPQLSVKGTGSGDTVLATVTCPSPPLPASGVTCFDLNTVIGAIKIPSALQLSLNGGPARTLSFEPSSQGMEIKSGRKVLELTSTSTGALTLAHAITVETGNPYYVAVYGFDNDKKLLISGQIASSVACSPEEDKDGARCFDLPQLKALSAQFSPEMDFQSSDHGPVTRVSFKLDGDEVTAKREGTSCDWNRNVSNIFRTIPPGSRTAGCVGVCKKAQKLREPRISTVGSRISRSCSSTRRALSLCLA